MSRHYKVGNKVVITRPTKACNSYGQSSGTLIDRGSTGIVTSYNTKYTDQIDDDLALIKILSGDKELLDKEVWIRSDDFKQVKIRY